MLLQREENKMLNIITKLIMEYVEVDESLITRETNPIKDLNLNSYDFISIIGKIESELGVEINERDIRKLETLGDLDDYIKAKMVK